ncbi:MAG: hypothetical protein ACTHJ4_03970, partial [Candidatus Nucleicultricaceae bacterium]
MHTFKKKLLTSVSALFLATVAFSGAANATARLSLGGDDGSDWQRIYSVNMGHANTDLKISANGANGRTLHSFFERFDSDNFEKDDSLVIFTSSSGSPYPSKIRDTEAFKPAFHALIQCFADKLVNRIYDIYEKADATELVKTLQKTQFVEEGKKATILSSFAKNWSSVNNPLHDALFVKVEGTSYRPFYKTMSKAITSSFAGEAEEKAQSLYDYLVDATHVFQTAAIKSIDSRIERDAVFEDNTKLERELSRLQGLYDSKEDAVDKLGREIYASKLKIQGLEKSIRALESAANSAAHELEEVQAEKNDNDAKSVEDYKQSLQVQLGLIKIALRDIPDVSTTQRVRARLTEKQKEIQLAFQTIEEQGLEQARVLNLFVNEEFEEIKAELTRKLKETQSAAHDLEIKLQAAEEETAELLRQLRQKDEQMLKLKEENANIQSAFEDLKEKCDTTLEKSRLQGLEDLRKLEEAKRQIESLAQKFEKAQQHESELEASLLESGRQYAQLGKELDEKVEELDKAEQEKQELLREKAESERISKES